MAEDPIIGYLLQTPEPAPPPKRGNFAQGWGVGVAGLKATAGGLGAFAGDVIGSDRMRQAGLDYAREQGDIASAGTRKVEDINSIGDAADFVPYALGTAMPSILTTILGGGVGGIAGKVIAKQLATNATKEMLKKASITGAVAGGGTASVGLGVGEVYPEALEEGVANPGIRSAVGGAAIGALDILPQLRLAHRLGLLGKPAAEIATRKPGALPLAGSVVKEGIALGAGEAITEGLQSVVGRAAAGKALTSPEAYSEYLNSAVIGAIAGGTLGGAAGAFTPTAKPAAAPTPQQEIAGLLPPPGPIAAGVAPAVDPERQAQVEAAQARADAIYAARDAEEARLAEVDPVRKAAALRQELTLPFEQRRPKADILRELRALNVPAETIEKTPPRAEPPASDIIETRPPDPDTTAAETAVAQMKRELGALVSSREAKLVPVVEKGDVRLVMETQNAPKLRIPVEKNASPERRAQVITELARESVARELPVLAAAAGTKSRQTLIKRAEAQLAAAAEKAAQAPNLAAATQQMRDAVRDIMKGKLPPGDVDTFAQAVMSNMQTAPTYYSKAARRSTAGLEPRTVDSTSREEIGDSSALLTTDELPGSVRADVDKTISEEAQWNAEGELRWQMRQLSPAEAETYLSEDWRSDSAFVKRAERLAKAIQKDGQKKPVIVGPSGVEGQHRLAAGVLLDMPITAYVSVNTPQNSLAAQHAAVDFRDTVLKVKWREAIDGIRAIIGDVPGLEFRQYDAQPGDPVGKFTRTGPFKWLIELAFNGKDVVSNAYHEAYHFLEMTKLTYAERRIVANALKPGKPLYEAVMARARAYDLTNGTKLADEIESIPAEARAYGFEFWRRGELTADGPLARAWQKLLNVVERIKNLINGLGFQSIEDVFEAVNKGAYAQREVLRDGGVELMSEASQDQWYYSALMKGIAAVDTKQASADGWKGVLKGLANKGIVKPTELEAVGVNEWLDTQSGRITKQQVMDFIGANGVRVEEVVLGGPQNTSHIDRLRVELDAMGWTLGEFEYNEQDDFLALGEVIRRSDGKVFDAEDIITNNAEVPEEVRQKVGDVVEALLDRNEGTGDGTRYSQYQLPGGQNYRELLLRLPGPNTDTLPGGTELLIDGQFFGRYATRQDAERSLSGLRSNPTHAARRFELRDVAAIPGVERELFRSSHFDQPNILAHVRFNERTDAEGKRVLFLEEIQSDWAQKGKREGFKGTNEKFLPEVRRRLAAKDAELVTRERQLREARDRSQGALTEADLRSDPLYRALVGERADIAGQLRALEREDNFIPSAPFVAKTEAWVALALKRMIRYAADNGFDRVAWTTGEQQAARYDLSKHIAALKFRKFADGTTSLIAKTPDGRIAMNETVANDKVADFVGKDMADKIAKHDKSGSTLTGLDLKVGGEGMKAFYDKIVPNVANDVLKKLGGGKVSVYRLPGARDLANTAVEVLNNQGQVVNRYGGRLNEQHNAQVEAERIGGTTRLIGGDTVVMQPGFDITPQMREKAVVEGMPLFSKAALLTQAEIEAELADMERRMAAGELDRVQYGHEYAKLLDRVEVSGTTKRQLFGAHAESMGNSISRFLMRHLWTGLHKARNSLGYANGNRVMETYIRFKQSLISQGSLQQLKDWHTASSDDIEAAAKALWDQNEHNYALDSDEYRAMRGKLTEPQRHLYDQARKMIADRLQREFEAEQITHARALSGRELLLWIKAQASTPTDEAIAEQAKAIDAAGVQAWIDKYIERTGKVPPESEVDAREGQSQRFAEWYVNRRARVKSLSNYYIPQRRYGDHTVRVYLMALDDEGQMRKFTAIYEQFESEAEAKLAMIQLRKMTERVNPNLQVEYQHRYAREYDGSLSFQQFLDLADRHGVQLSQRERERIAKALLDADSMRFNRVFRRQNVPGFAKDMNRVLNEFIVLTSNKIAQIEFSEAINESLYGRPVDARVVEGKPVISIDREHDLKGNPVDAKSDLWAVDGPDANFYRKLLDETAAYVLTPDHSGQAGTKLRAAAMLYFLGGSLAVPVVNSMSIPMMTVPWLSQYTGYTNATAITLAAWKTAWANNRMLRDINVLKDRNTAIPALDNTPGLRDAMILAAETGITQDLEIYQVMGISQGQMFAQSRKVQKAMDVWMAPFRISEQMNRITSFMAAYRIGREGIKQADGSIKQLTGRELYDFAADSVGNTQNVYDEANRPGFARTPVGAMLFMFKSFPMFMVEMMIQLGRDNPKALARMLLGIVVFSGINGLPFAESLQDIVDVISQRVFGSPFNSRRAMRNLVKDASEIVTGVDLSGVLMRGLINDMADINIAARVGMGSFVPGTRLGAADSNYARVAEQLLGAPIAMLVGAGTGLTKLAKGDLEGALRAGGPTAVRNLIKGAEQFSTGEALDSQGRKLMDATGPQAFWQTLGFTSGTLAHMYDMDMIDKQTTAFYKQAQDAFADDLTKAVRRGDAEKAQEVYAAIQAWNEAYPQMPIGLAPATMRRRLVEAGLRLDERTLRNLPRALRASSVSAETVYTP